MTTRRADAEGADRPANAHVHKAQLDEPPLYVDLDGTLIRADTLVLSVRKLLQESPWAWLSLPRHLIHGRAAFKGHLARSVPLDPGELPYREDVLVFLRREKARGRSLVLATAAHIAVAEAVATHLGLFDHVIATVDSTNLKGRSKLAAIRAHAPDGVFDYVGDSGADLPIFRSARESFLVHPSPRLLKQARKSCRIRHVFDS